MKNLITFDEFVKNLNESAQLSNQESKKYRNQKLAGIETDDLDDKYCILISVGNTEGNSLITEYEKYKSFKKTTNRYVSHPANPDIPVKAHYHIYPNNGKNEIYSVNTDGTAHHKKNKGFKIPKKEADELRKLGVNIPDNRILENLEIDISNLELDQIILLVK